MGLALNNIYIDCNNINTVDFQFLELTYKQSMGDLIVVTEQNLNVTNLVDEKVKVQWDEVDGDIQKYSLKLMEKK